VSVNVASLEERAQAAERKAAQLRRVVELVGELGEEGLRELLAVVEPEGERATNGHARAPYVPPPKNPRGREALRLIVADRPGMWTMAELKDEMHRRGWFASDKGVEVAAVRLVTAGEWKRDGKGRYVAPADSQEGGRD
jgi:hypothetical protein